MKLDRTNQLLLATLVLLGALAGLRLLDDLRPPEALWSVPPVSPPAVQAIRWTTPDGAIVLARADSGWRIAEPIDRPADAEKIGTLLRDWSEGFTPDLRLDPRPSSATLASVELDDALRSELVLEGASGPLAHLLMGKKIGGGSHYVQRPGEDSLFRGRVPGSFRLSTDPDAWRDVRLFPFAKDDLAELTIEGSHGRFVFARVETTERAFWEGREPAGFAPSSRALDQMGRSLGNLKAQKILEGADASPVTEATMTVTARTEGGATYTLRFGAEDEASKTVPASIDGDDRSFVLSAAVLRQFDKPAAQLRDKTVVRFRRPEEPRITWTEGDRRVVVVPAGERDWRIEEPAGFAPEEAQLKLAANSLLNLQAAEVIDEATELPGGGPTILIETTDGAQTLRLAPAPDEQGRHLAQVDGRAETFVLRGAVVERLLTTLRGEASD